MFALYSTPLYLKDGEIYTKKGLNGFIGDATPIEYNEINTESIHCAFSELFTNTMMNLADNLFADLYGFYESVVFVNGDEEDDDGNLIEVMSAYIIDHATADDLCKHTDVPVAYCEKYDMYFLCVTFCGCSWDYVNTVYTI